MCRVVHNLKNRVSACTGLVLRSFGGTAAETADAPVRESTVFSCKMISALFVLGLYYDLKSLILIHKPIRTHTRFWTSTAAASDYRRVGTLIVATIYLQLIQNRYMFRSFTVLQCNHQHCVQPVASDLEVVGYL